ncbi:hypothetical protein ACQEU5_21170 [Marinactinospora thermotolerans]
MNFIALLSCSSRFAGGQGGAPAVPAQRKARREYENRVTALAPGADRR